MDFPKTSAGSDLVVEVAGPADAAPLAALRRTVARDLTLRYGPGAWSLSTDTEEGVRLDMMGATLLLARHAGMVVGSLRLSLRPPWLGDLGAFRFSRVRRPMHLTSMAVSPGWQGRGVGRRCLAEAEHVARVRGADALRLDCFDAPAGAADFYRKSGYVETARATYLGTPLIFMERLVPRKAKTQV